MVGLEGARVVAILTRAPTAGGKTRLFAALGRRADPALLQALLLDTIDGVAARGVVRVVAVEPGHAADEIRALVPPDIRVTPQVDGSLGERMRMVMADLFGRGARAVVLVGSDLPEIEPGTVTGAFAALDRDPGLMVLGPAPDGGYFLIGATRVPDVFDGIPWSGATVLEETLALAARRGIPVELLEPLSDVDTAYDLERLASGPEDRAARTASWARAQGIGPRSNG